MPEFVFSACICNYFSCNFDNIPGLIGYKESRECLCCQDECCCALNGEAFSIGIIKEEGMLIKCGLPCCTCGIKIPDKLCLGTAECLCCKGAAAFPFVEPVSAPVCAICAFSLIPEVGFMKPPPGGGAPPSVEMQR